MISKEEAEEYLAHYGVLGMKWGKTKADGSYKNLAKAQKNYDKTVNKNWYKTYNNAADYANSHLIPAINKKYNGSDVSDNTKGVGKKFMDEYNTKFNKVWAKEIQKMYGDRPTQ
tara:strand:+ start:754 stop:1095 length:342 start_codon:yes stop_codon:yes gene_type:complete